MPCDFHLKQNDNMDLKKIVAISGRPGLYEIVAQTRNCIVAQSLSDGKRISTAISQKLSVLGDIQIYSLEGEVPLEEVLKKIYNYEKGAKCKVAPKAPTEDLEAYFFEVLDTYDEERVYASDIKKIVQWYNLLISKNWNPSDNEENVQKEKSSKSSPADAPSKNQSKE